MSSFMENANTETTITTRRDWRLVETPAVPSVILPLGWTEKTKIQNLEKIISLMHAVDSCFSWKTSMTEN